MSEDWLHEIHDRMSDYEVDEPDGLWSLIEEKRSPVAARRGKPDRFVLRGWTRWMSVAAIFIAVLSVCLWLILPLGYNASVPGLVPDMTLSGRHVAAVAGGSCCVPPSAVAIRETITADDTPLGQIAENNETRCVDTISVIGEDAESCVTVDSAVCEKDSVTVPSVKKWDYRSDASHGRNIASITPRRDTGGRVSLSVLYSSGGSGDISGGYSAGNLLVSSIGADNSGWKDNPLLGILLFNQGKDIKTSIKHRLPVRVGLSAAYDFNDRMAVEGGLCYTRLTSDVREGSESHYFTGEQKLQYIGIPVSFKYRVFSLRRLDLYASAGVLGEKCVSAEVDKNFVIDNQSKRNETERLHDKPFQFSVNASVGLQFNIVNRVGLFVEPGVSYHFDDGTSIRHIYRDHPLNFSLSTGLRFTFGR